MSHWIGDLAELADAGEASVIVTVASVRGSAPREVGAKMIVTATETIGTIGGGQLEYQCTRLAWERIQDDSISATRHLRRFALGANCGQCCGGVVEVMLEKIPATGAGWLPVLVRYQAERIPVVVATPLQDNKQKFLVTSDSCDSFGAAGECPGSVVSAAQEILAARGVPVSQNDYLLEPVRPNAFNVAVFGAGHVGTATVDVLKQLDCHIRWIDSRARIFPKSLPANICAIDSAHPVREVLAMPAGTMYLVMTHSHPLDQEICTEVLRREDFAYCGLIGSLSKRRRFERLMKKQGISQSLLDRLVCPIGVPGVEGRKPAEIAIAVAAEVLQVRDAALGRVARQHGKKTYVRAL